MSQIGDIAHERHPLSRDEWNNCLDKYRNDISLSSEEHERMDERQKWMIHELDKSDARLEVK